VAAARPDQAKLSEPSFKSLAVSSFPRSVSFTENGVSCAFSHFMGRSPKSSDTQRLRNKANRTGIVAGGNLLQSQSGIFAQRLPIFVLGR
jgi:hypothetical protein